MLVFSFFFVIFLPYVAYTIPIVTPHICSGLNTCRIYKLENPTDTNSCGMKGTTIYNKEHTDPSTMDPFEGVNDNYVAHYVNEKDTSGGSRTDSSSSDVGPRVKITVKLYPYSSTPKNHPEKGKVVFHKIYNWQHFMNHIKPHILEQLQYSKIGLYTLEIQGIDYFAVSQCTFEAILIDPYTHKPEITCPTVPSAAIKNDLGISSDLKQFYDWKTGKRDPYCKAEDMEDLRIDPVSSATHTFTVGTDASFTSSLNDEQQKTCYNLLQQDIEALKTYANSKTTKSCKTECTLHGELYRKNLIYNCDEQKWTEGIRLQDDTCDYHGSIELAANDLFTTSLKPISSPTDFFTTTVSEYAHTITVNCHGRFACFTKDEKFKFSKYLSLTTTVNLAWATVLEDDIAAYTYTRYSVDGGVNFHESLSEEITIESSPVSLVIEVYSACGAIYSETYSLIQKYNEENTHISNAVCSVFKGNCFHKVGVPMGTGTLIEDKTNVCAYKGNSYSSFIPFSLSYDRNDYKSLFDAGTVHEINAIYCEIRISGTPQGKDADDRDVSVNIDSDAAVLIPETHLTSDGLKKFYAMKLIRDKQTYPFTPLKTKCYISVKQNELSPYENVICDFEFYGKDCTIPNTMPNPTCKAYEEGVCHNDFQSSQIAPGGICKGNYISATTPNLCDSTTAPCRVDIHVGTLDNYDSSVCCDECGHAQCDGIPESDGELRQCVFSEPSLHAFLGGFHGKRGGHKRKNHIKLEYSAPASLVRLPAAVMRNYGILAFMTLGTVVCGIVVATAMMGFNIYRRRQMIKNEDGYSPLI